MKCFQFYVGDKKEEPKTVNSNSVLSTSSVLSDREFRNSRLESCSQNASDTSTESRGRSQFPSLSDRPSNLRVFTFSELKSATKNFNRTTKIGEGGFGCVYKATVKSGEDSVRKIDVAVKQLGRRGLQVTTFFFLSSNNYVFEKLGSCILISLFIRCWYFAVSTL